MMDELCDDAPMCADDASMDYSSIYLDAALKRLSCHPYVCQWSPEKSIFKLLYIFCLPELDGLLNVIKMLSARSRNVEMICLRCVDEGEVAQLAALLLFSWDSLVAPFADKGIETSPIAQHILKELIHKDLESRHLDSRKCSYWQPRKKSHLTSAWGLLTALVYVRDIILSYWDFGWAKHIPNYDVPFDIAHDIWKNYAKSWKLFFKREDVYSDDIPCLRPHLNPRNKAALNEALQSQMRLGCSSIIDLPVSFSYGRPTDDGDSSDTELLGDDIYDLSEDDPEYHLTFKDALRSALEEDDKDEFVELINLSKGKKELLSDIAEPLYGEDAVDCFAAVLAGETNGLLTLSGIMSRDALAGWTLLHEAAKRSATRIIALLLGSTFAADANTRSDCCELSLVQALPLDLALAKTRSFCMDSWAGRKSAVGLVIRLTQINMSEYLESLRLLALKTNNVKQQFLKYLFEGKMFEVGALLMVARKQLLSSSDIVGYASIGELYDRMLNNLLRDTSSSPIGVQCQPRWMDTLMEKNETLALLEIFDKIGEELTAYIQLEQRLKLIPQQIAVEVATILEDAGFLVTHEEIYVYNPQYRYTSRMFEESFLSNDTDTNFLVRLLGGNSQPTQTVYDEQASATQHLSTVSSKPAASLMFDMELPRRECVPVCGLMSNITLKAKPVRRRVSGVKQMMGPPLTKYRPAARVCAYIVDFARRMGH